MGVFLFAIAHNGWLYAPGRGFQTSCGFISLNAWLRVKRNPQ